MKTVILAGGFGTRLSEETVHIPKPMVEIGSKPILWNIMQTYSYYGFKEFIVACGYKSEVIKDYFANYLAHNSDWKINLATGQKDILKNEIVDWNVSVIDTGIKTMTGGRVLRLHKWLEGETFMLTYGDGVADIDINALLKFHKSHGRIATVTAVRPPSRFGEMMVEGDQVVSFSEKPQTSVGWINGGFFVFEPKVFDYLNGDSSILEREPLENLAKDKQLLCYKHDGFWQPMDTLRDKVALTELYEKGKALWLKGKN